MCLAVPGQIVALDKNRAEVDFSGVRRMVEIRLVPEAKIGDYVLVHAGCALQLLPSDDALEISKLLDEVFEKR